MPIEKGGGRQSTMSVTCCLWQNHESRCQAQAPIQCGVRERQTTQIRNHFPQISFFWWFWQSLDARCPRTSNRSFRGYSYGLSGSAHRWLFESATVGRTARLGTTELHSREYSGWMERWNGSARPHGYGHGRPWSQSTAKKSPMWPNVSACHRQCFHTRSWSAKKPAWRSTAGIYHPTRSQAHAAMPASMEIDHRTARRMSVWVRC